MSQLSKILNAFDLKQYPIVNKLEFVNILINHKDTFQRYLYLEKQEKLLTYVDDGFKLIYIDPIKSANSNHIEDVPYNTGLQMLLDIC